MTDPMIILGCHASGKTTLARRLAAELTVPLLSKDDIKEALFDILGVGDRERSRRLSEACFAAQLRIAQTQLYAGLCCLLEEGAGAGLENLAPVTWLLARPASDGRCLQERPRFMSISG